MELTTNVAGWVRTEVGVDSCAVINTISINGIEVGTAIICSVKTATCTDGCTLCTTGYRYKELKRAQIN